MLKELGKLIKKEIKCICEVKMPSILRDRSVDNMRSFTWSSLIKEIEKTSPTLLQLLTDCVARKQKFSTLYHAKDEAITGVCAAILLCHHNQLMNKFQRLVSVLRYSEHVPVRVRMCMIIINCKINFIHIFTRFLDGYENAIFCNLNIWVHLLQ